MLSANGHFCSDIAMHLSLVTLELLVRMVNHLVIAQQATLRLKRMESSYVGLHSSVCGKFPSTRTKATYQFLLLGVSLARNLVLSDGGWLWG